MFTHWKWIQSSIVSFEMFVRSQLDRLRSCNRTLYERPRTLLALPPHEVRTYFDRCFRGTWQDSLHVVLPNVCVRAYAAAASTPHLTMHLPIPDGISLYLRRVHPSARTCPISTFLISTFQISIFLISTFRISTFRISTFLISCTSASGW